MHTFYAKLRSTAISQKSTVWLYTISDKEDKLWKQSYIWQLQKAPRNKFNQRGEIIKKIEDTEKCSWIRIISFANLYILLKAIYRFNAILI